MASIACARDRIVVRDRIDGLNAEEHFVVDLLDFLEVLLAVGDLDADLLEGGQDGKDLVRPRLDLGEALEDVVGGQVALFFAPDDQLLGNGDQLVRKPARQPPRELAPAPGLGLGCSRPGSARDLVTAKMCSAIVGVPFVPVGCGTCWFNHR